MVTAEPNTKHLTSLWGEKCQVPLSNQHPRSWGRNAVYCVFYPRQTLSLHSYLSVIYTCKASLCGQKYAPVRRPHLWQTGVAMPVTVTPARAKTAPPLQVEWFKGKEHPRNAARARPALAQDFWFCFPPLTWREKADAHRNSEPWGQSFTRGQVAQWDDAASW